MGGGEKGDGPNDKCEGGKKSWKGFSKGKRWRKRGDWGGGGLKGKDSGILWATGDEKGGVW